MSEKKAKREPFNICGKKVAALRMQMQPKVSQNKLAAFLQLEGINCSKNTVQQIESQERRVSDFELKALAKVLHTTADDLISDE